MITLGYIKSNAVKKFIRVRIIGNKTNLIEDKQQTVMHTNKYTK